MTNNTNSKSKKSGWIAIILILVFIVIIVSTCSDDNKEPVADTQTATVKDYPADSLVAYLNKNVDLQDGMRFVVSKFDAQNCIVDVTVPEETGKTAADVVGKGFCILMAKWLSEKDYTMDYSLYIGCYVYSPYIGVTGKNDMVTKWGRAMYDPGSDAVEWKWEEK